MLQCDTVHAFICCTNRHLLVGHSARSSLSSYLGSLSFNTEYGSTTSAALSDVIILSSLFHSRLSAAALCCLCGTGLSERRNVPSLIRHLPAKYDIPAAFLILLRNYRSIIVAQRSSHYICQGNMRFRGIQWSTGLNGDSVCRKWESSAYLVLKETPRISALQQLNLSGIGTQ